LNGVACVMEDQQVKDRYAGLALGRLDLQRNDRASTADRIELSRHYVAKFHDVDVVEFRVRITRA
jgi:hypothetical protein